MRVLLVCLLALAVAAPALAAEPGFRESPRLSVRASNISGVPAKVYCANTAAEWIAFSESYGFPSDVAGLTFIGSSTTYLPLDGCLPLEQWLRGRNPGWFALGRAASSFVHESVHLRGVRDEREAECTAYRELPRWLRSHFGIKRPKVLKAVMLAATSWHRLVMAAGLEAC